MNEVKIKIKDVDNNPLETEEFLMHLIHTSIKHKKENRALAFAFLVYNFESPQVSKVLDDEHYWDSLQRITSSYLSIFYIHSDEESLNQKKVYLSPSDIGKVSNNLFPYKNIGGPSDIEIHVLQNFFNIKEIINLPAIIFFEIENQSISDSIFLELEEKEIEKSFIELKEAITEVVSRVKNIDKENYDNGNEIFREIKVGLEKLNHKKVFKKINKLLPLIGLKSLFGL